MEAKHDLGKLRCPAIALINGAVTTGNKKINQSFDDHILNYNKFEIILACTVLVYVHHYFKTPAHKQARDGEENDPEEPQSQNMSYQ